MHCVSSDLSGKEFGKSLDSAAAARRSCSNNIQGRPCVSSRHLYSLPMGNRPRTLAMHNDPSEHFYLPSGDFIIPGKKRCADRLCNTPQVLLASLPIQRSHLCIATSQRKTPSRLEVWDFEMR